MSSMEDCNGVGNWDVAKTKHLLTMMTSVMTI